MSPRSKILSEHMKAESRKARGRRAVSKALLSPLPSVELHGYGHGERGWRMNRMINHCLLYTANGHYYASVTAKGRHIRGRGKRTGLSSASGSASPMGCYQMQWRRAGLHPSRDGPGLDVPDARQRKRRTT